MKRSGIHLYLVLVTAVLVTAYFSARGTGLSVRIVHPRSAQLMEKIERGQVTVPPTYEVLEVEDERTGEEEHILVSRAEELTDEHFAAVEIAENGGQEDLYLRLTEEGRTEFYDMVSDFQGGQLAIVNEEGEVLNLQRIPRQLRQGRLPIFVSRQSHHTAERLAQELREEI